MFIVFEYSHRAIAILCLFMSSQFFYLIQILCSMGTKVHCIVWERYPFLELSAIQMSEPNNRPTVRNLIKAKSQTSSLINQRCRLSFITKCVSLSHTVCGCWSTLPSVSINTRTDTLCLSLSLCYLALFPHLSISFKKPSLRLFDYQLKYRFHRTRLFSFHR
jgi:hypothetical protein